MVELEIQDIYVEVEDSPTIEVSVNETFSADGIDLYQKQTDWDETNTKVASYLKNKPLIPTKTSQLSNDSNFVVDANYVHTDNNFSNTEKNKLLGIENNANNYILPSDVVQDTDYVHTDNNFSNLEKNKLSGIENNANNYILPTASISTLGGIKVDGTTVKVTDGILSAVNGGYSLPKASQTVLGGVKIDGTTITINGDGVISGSSSYTLPTASTSTLGGVKIDGSSIIINNGIISTPIVGNVQTDWNASSGLAVLLNKPTKVSSFTNDVGYLTSFTETDPTVPAWAKQPTKPTYTKAEVGLGNVDNTSDINKPVSTTQQVAIDKKVDKTTTINTKSLSDNITLVKGDIGLGNVDNTSDANKPVSSATQSALDNKVDKITGKGLSTNDYTTDDKNKLAGISANAASINDTIVSSTTTYSSSKTTSLLDNKLGNNLSNNSIFVGNTSNLAVEQPLIPLRDANLSNPGQINPVQFSLKMNIDNGQISYLHQVFRSNAFSVFTQGITQLCTAEINRNIIVKDVYVRIQGVSGTGDGTFPLLSLSANSDGSSPFANVQSSDKFLTGDGFRMAISNDLVSLANGVFFVCGSSTTTRAITASVIINAIYL